MVSDFAVEPQWRPEWILPKIIVADVFGRAVGAWHRILQDAAPPSWKERIEKVYAWIVAEKIGAFAQYPPVLQGTRRPHRPTLAEFQSGIPQAADAFRELANNPSVDTLLSISPFIEAFGFPDDAIGDAEKVVASIREAPPDEDDKSTVLALSVLAHIAVLAENAALADRISEVCLERARRTENQGPIFEIACRLIECTAVIEDRAEAARKLAPAGNSRFHRSRVRGRRRPRGHHRNAQANTARDGAATRAGSCGGPARQSARGGVTAAHIVRGKPVDFCRFSVPEFPSNRGRPLDYFLRFLARSFFPSSIG